jgi:hypothetical protein
MASIRSIATIAALIGSTASSVAPPVKRAIPALAQVISQKSFNVLPSVPSADDYNASSVRTYEDSLQV